MRHQPLTVIVPQRGFAALRLGDVWSSRELLGFLALRDVRARYKQTALGLTWAVVQPLLMMAVLTIFLGRVVHVPSEGKPYALFALAGVIPWTFFSNGLTGASESLVNNADVLSKVYFPRLVLPLAAVLAWGLDAVIATLLLVVVLIVSGTGVLWTVVLAPPAVVLVAIVAGALGIALAPVNVAYRDVRYALALVMQLWLFATPVAYPVTLVSRTLRPVLYLNPMTGVVLIYRWALLGTAAPPAGALIGTLAVTAAALVSGLVYFRRVEHRIVDVI